MKNKKRLSRTAKLIRLGTIADERRRKQIERDHMEMFGHDFQHAPISNKRIRVNATFNKLEVKDVQSNVIQALSITGPTDDIRVISAVLMAREVYASA